MSLMYAQMGMSAVSALSQYSTGKHRASMEKITRDYRETMSGISFAMQSNNLTHNEIEGRDAMVRANSALQVQSMRDRANAEVSAAAAGVAGGSVRSTMQGLQRSKLLASNALKKKQAAQAKVNRNNRRGAALSRAMNKDISPISQPSAASALLGLGASLIDIYDSNQPEGSKTTDTIAGWGRD